MDLPVSWELAGRVGTRVAGARGLTRLGTGQDPQADMSSLESDFAEVTAIAEEMVARSTGLRPLAGPARALVVDRPAWVQANLASFRSMLERALAEVDRPLPGGLLGGAAAGATRAAAGAELGALLGWMSSRVLGQYDILLAEAEDEGGVVSYVGPNVAAMERRHGFPPRQFRLWIAIHEVTHRAQFTGVPWMREYFVGLVERSIAALVPDPARMGEVFRRLADSLGKGVNPLGDMGLLGVMLSPEQLGAVEQVQALMSVLEGHGDVTMDRAGHDALPEARWFSQVLRDRRRHPPIGARIVQQLSGIGAKMRQYEQGERFVRAVEAAGGPELFAKVWQGAEWLPTLDELREPQSWLDRCDGGSGMPSAGSANQADPAGSANQADPAGSAVPGAPSGPPGAPQGHAAAVDVPLGP
ncbi:MAG: zinc-dependent metalloprotease [Acidimicrobiales bacterium]